MRVYFLSEKRGALTVGGAYFGVVDGFERSAELDPADGLFCECAAIGYLPVRFCFDEHFLFAPPPHIKLYFSGGAVAVWICDFLREDPTLRVIWQDHVADSRLTLCMQGRLRLDLNNETGFHLIPLPERLERAKPSACCGGILLESEAAFCLISRDGELLVCGDGRVLERGETLKAEVSFHDSVGHTAVCEWRGKELVSCTVRTTRPPTDFTFALAFFESVLIGADVTPYLSDELKPKAGILREFLGKFEAVLPQSVGSHADPQSSNAHITSQSESDRNTPQSSNTPAAPQSGSSYIGLVYARRERVFEVRTFRADISGGKVINITEL